MSLEYSFRKQDIPFAQWHGKIDSIVVPAEPGKVPEGAWRELLVSNMVRSLDEGGGGGYSAKFLTEGSIRGVLVSEEDERIAIKLHSFASRGDQMLAARLAWEAMHLGAAVEREDDGKIGTDDLSEEAVEAIHRQWFAMSKASIRGKSDIRLPIYDFLAISLAAGDGEKDDETLENDLIRQMAGLGDAFLSSRMVLTKDGVGEITACILQPEMRSLVPKDVDAVACDNQVLVSLTALVDALGGQVKDGHGCWVFPPVSQIPSSILQSVAAKGFTSGSSVNAGGLTDEDWNFIAQGPVIAFMMVAAADGNVDQKEVESFRTVLMGLAAQQQHAGVARMMQASINQLHVILPRLMSGNADPLQLMKAFTMLIDEKFSTADAGALKASLLFLAQQVAVSSGGFLGFGPKISKNEKKALGALALLLGLAG